jgi:hypothetical protein
VRIRNATVALAGNRQVFQRRGKTELSLILVQSIQEAPQPAHIVVRASEKECFGEIYLSSAHRDSAYQVPAGPAAIRQWARYFVALTVPNHIRRTVYFGGRAHEILNRQTFHCYSWTQNKCEPRRCILERPEGHRTCRVCDAVKDGCRD